MTNGERWAADELGKLRAAHFAPPAWVRFMRESFRQAKQTRRARAALTRQARIWSTVGLGCAAAAPALASRRNLPAPRSRHAEAWWLLVCAMLDWHLGMVEGAAGEPRERLSLADALTLHRLWLIPFIEAQSDHERRCPPIFSGLVAWAGATDILDGAVARRVGPTRLGRDLDKAADTILISTAAHTAHRAGWLPPFAAGLVHLRSTLPVAYVAASYFATGQRPIVDSLGAGRRLAPFLLGGLAIAPHVPRLGAHLTSASSIASLLLVVPPVDASSGSYHATVF